MLQAYEDIKPGYADRIMDAFERQEAHRQYLERITIEGDGRRAWAGIMRALVIALVFLGGGILLALTRHDTGGTVLSGIIGVGGLVGLVGVFVYGTNSRRQERARKSQQIKEDR